MKGNFLRYSTVSTLVASILMMSGCTRSPASAIESVLNQSVGVSKRASSFTADPASQAGYVADGLQAIDTSGCPQEFRVAFQDHVNAWRSAQAAYAQNSIGNNIVQGAVAALTDNPSAIGSLGLQAFAANQDINNTYFRLTMIAATYGARVGLTDDLKDRLRRHNAGEVNHTAKYRPWKLEVAVAFNERAKASQFEIYLKSHSGRAFAKRHF
jgi:predicted GIY-YIG superfamily endonuclease